MSLRKTSLLISAGTALFFSLLYLAPFFTMAEYKIYDFFLRFRPKRERIDNLVFLDVDDQAVAHVGVFPWPRSVMADGLLRLKEYGAAAAIFDIEYIDKSPTQVDEVYLRQGLAADFNRRFSEIGANMADILSALSAGHIRAADAAAYIDDVTGLIAGERDSLYRDTLGLTRDNDLYLARAAALFGSAWGTLNLQDEFPLTGEQAERRAMAEARFAYPVASSGEVPGGAYTDVLPAIPLFMEAVRGAGFTNVEVDRDGTRRRIYLTRKVMDHWYVQLAFALLLEYLGNPALEQRPRRLVLKGARLPGAARRGAPMPADIRIPLDEDGAMLLDWPLTAYNESYAHVSFARFSYLEEYYAHIEEYLYGLAPVKHLFPALSEGAAAILGLLAEAEGARERALENVSDEDFEQYVGLREEGLRAAEELLAAAPAYIQGELAARSGRPGYAAVLEEAAYCGTLVEYLGTELNHIKETQNYLKTALGGKFCILGRVDTGTTDIGVNPFHGEYVNVGTHAVVLDTILSQSFITILPSLWSVIAAFLLVPLLITGIGGFKPVFRISLGISGVVLFTGASLALFALGGVFLGPLGPALAMVSALIIRESIAFAGTEREKQFIRKAFSTYLSGDVVEELLNDPAKLSLGGQTRRMSALFTDVRGFSTISEKLSDLYGPQGGAEALVRLLNDYLSAMSTIVLEQRGTIDKYEGDAIIAFFGAPLEVADHALRACVSAVMMKRLEGELNRKYAETGMSPAPLYTRIGINTGPMVVGNMGTQRKMDYTIMGNAVNLAARLEGVNKLYGSWILASEDTVKAAAGKILSRRLDRVRVVGIHEPVRLYEVLEIAAEAPKRMMEMAALFHKALEIFESRNWTAAAVVFEEVLNHSPEDGPAKVYLERCGLYRNKPPEKDWDGVIALERK